MTLQPDPVHPIPVTILAGFLGSGKTTLLNRILREQHGLRLGVLVNDFGDLDIDSQLLAGSASGDIISLPNGCICCTLFSSLVETMRRLVQHPDRPDHILIEASGVSSPGQIADILDVKDLVGQVELDGIITLVDAENVRLIARVVMFIESQLQSADVVVINKIDLVPAAEVDALIAWVRDIVPDARIIPTRFAAVPLELVLDHIHTDRPVPTGDHDEHHDLVYGTCSYESDQPFARPALLALMSALPPSIFRAKGIVWMHDTPERQTIVQVSGRRLRLEPGGPWPESNRRSQLVFIGEPALSDDTELARALDACLVVT